jgi:hypothetical protein
MQREKPDQATGAFGGALRTREVGAKAEWGDETERREGEGGRARQQESREKGNATPPQDSPAMADRACCSLLAASRLGNRPSLRTARSPLVSRLRGRSPSPTPKERPFW